jgi:dTDP-4-amino-4,6-dideoxygalactose transaminase
MYVPAWPVLRPAHFLGHPRGCEAELPFPLVARGTYFYVARNGIYHLFKALQGGTVLVPAYHHGNEVRAIRAAGTELRFYGIDRNLEPDLDEIRRLVRPGVRALFAIHYLGWPQPLRELKAICRERGLIFIEDCALSWLSASEGRPLGSTGDYAIFCLYKTVALPNGGLLVHNRRGPASLVQGRLRRPDRLSVAARTSELLLQFLRSRSDAVGGLLMALKRTIGRGLSAARMRRTPVGDTGFDVAGADTAMSPLCHALLRRFDYRAIRERRRSNYTHLLERLSGRTSVLDKPLAEGVCPLFFPLLVRDKREAAHAFRARGIEAVEFWNQGDPEADGPRFPEVRFLREHLLELPVHQDVSPSQVDYMADQALALGVRL